jgi:pyrimidine-nucleoside phosphorylase
MKTLDDSRRLAQSLVAIGNASGVHTEALITDMNAPLGRAVGNANEVVESIETLKGQGPEDLEALSVELAAKMLVLAKVAATDREAAAKVRRALSSGAALEVFRRVIENQGGNGAVIDDYSLLPSAPDEHRVAAPRNGHVAELRAEHIGRAAVALGAGRARLEDAVDHGVGIQVIAPPGTSVRAGDVVMVVRHRGGRGLKEALPLLDAAIEIAAAPPPRRSLVVDTVREGQR